MQQSFIAEWQSPNFHVLQERGFELMLLLVPIAFVFRRPSLWDVCLTLVVSYLALSAVRHAALFVAAETPLLIWSFSAGWERCALGRRRARVDQRRCARDLLAGAAAVLVVAVLGTGYFVHSRCPIRREPQPRTSRWARPIGWPRTRRWERTCSTSTVGGDT